MSIKIKKIVSTNNSGAVEVIGRELKCIENDALSLTLIDSDENEEYPYLVESSDGNIYRFNSEGISERGTFHLTEVSIMRLKTSTVVSENDWTEIEFNEDFSNVAEKLNEFGYKEKIFAVLTDIVSETSIPPIPSLKETHELQTRWVVRIDYIENEGDVDDKGIVPSERVVGIMDYINKETKEVTKKQVFIGFRTGDNSDVSICGVDQLKSIRPATEEEISIWEESGTGKYNDFEYIPLLLNSNGTFEKDPDLLELEELLKDE